jgi:hypothetical protein
MPKYRGTLYVERVQAYEFEVEADTPQEAQRIMQSTDYFANKEEYAINDPDDVETMNDYVDNVWEVTN